jgi:tRNA(Ile)-lysidine synthase
VVQVRTRREGDRIEKLGAPGSRKLSDEMIDRKIGRWRRDRILLLADGNRVLWMVGYAVAHETRITPATAQTLRIAYIAETEDQTDA